MPHKYLTDLVHAGYPTTQALAAGRRQRVLNLLHSSWPRIPPTGNTPSVELVWEEIDQDPLDDFINSSEAPGILIRTDFTNDTHWGTLVSKMQESEKELLDSFRPSPTTSNDEVEMGSSNKEEGEDNDDSSDDEEGQLPESVIIPFNPPPTAYTTLTNISNLTALRLFNDVDIRSAIPPPPELEGSKYKSNNVLVNLNGWQEIYERKNLWIYDAQSIQDDCVRVVEQAGAVYGAATGDSWRARITHIPELQFNMAFLGMKIDFGGLDRWDATERARNLAEASVLPT